MDPMLGFDLILALALVALAWAVLAAEDLFAAVILYMVFGLMTALAWVRLAAPDVALAEAAIGAGLGGALMLAAARRAARRRPAADDADAADNGSSADGAHR
jgi:uncharacterized MnhB-related membrane protein